MIQDYVPFGKTRLAADGMAALFDCLKKFVIQRFLLPGIACLLVAAWPSAVYSDSSESAVIGAIVCDGGSAFDQQQLLNAYIDLLGAPATEDNLDRIKNRIVALYGESNYYLPEVTVAAHAETANVFVVSIREPILHSYNVVGGNSRLQAEAMAFLNPLIGSPIYASFLFNDLAVFLRRQLGVNLNLSPGHVPDTVGDFQVNVALQGKSEFELTLSNEGSDRLGKETMAAEWRLIDTIPDVREFYLNTFNTISSDGFRSLGSGLVVAATKRNELLVDANISRARLAVSGEEDTVFDKQNYSLGWRLHIAEQFQHGSGISLALLARDFQQSQINDDIDEKLRLVDLGYWAYQVHQRTAFSWQLGTRKGLDAMGADLSGPQADPNTDIDFTRLNASLVTLMQFPARWSLRIDTQTQYSDDNLPFSQRFAIASNATARAFESGELNGDSGAGVKLEIRRDLNLDAWQAQWVPYAYYGFGRVKDNLTDDSISGASVGIGSRLMGEDWNAYLEVGKPLIEESIYKTSTPRAQASFSYRF